MRRAVFSVVVAALAGPSAAAQWVGVPIWNSPSGETGVTFAGDYARSNLIGSKSDAFGGRVSLGVTTVTLTAGMFMWRPETFPTRVASYGGTVAFRLIGGTALPLAVNLQLGAAHNPRVTSGTDTLYQTTTGVGAVGISLPLPLPLIRIEPYVSPGVRYHKYWNVAPGVSPDGINFGWVIGGNVGVGPIGAHVALDSERMSSGKYRRLFGAGAAVSIRVPLDR